MDKTIVYQALYCPFTEESDYGTLSIHFSREGAEKALKEHKEEIKKKHDEFINWQKEEGCYNPKSDNRYNKFKSWVIKEVEILP